MHNDTYTVRIDYPPVDPDVDPQYGAYEIVHDGSGGVVDSGQSPLRQTTVRQVYENDIQNRHGLTEAEAFMHVEKVTIINVAEREQIQDRVDAYNETVDDPANENTLQDELPDPPYILYAEVDDLI